MSLYDAPEKDLDRETITSEWKYDSIMDFLHSEYDNPVEALDFEDEEELEDHVENLVFDDDWIVEQLSGEEGIGEEYVEDTVRGLAKPEQINKGNYEGPLWPNDRTGFHRKGRPEEGVIYEPAE